MIGDTVLSVAQTYRYLKPGVHTNDFAPIHRLRALKLGHASLATVFRPGRLTLQPILRENLDSPVLRYQPITTAVVTDACLNTRWHHGAYTSAVLRESLGLDRVVTVYVELSRPDWLATVQSGRKQVQSRVCTPSLRHTITKTLSDEADMEDTMREFYFCSDRMWLVCIAGWILAVCCYHLTNKIHEISEIG